LIFPVRSLFFPLVETTTPCWLLELPVACAALLGLVLVGAVGALAAADGVVGALATTGAFGVAALGGLNCFLGAAGVEVEVGSLADGVELAAFPASV
jgi:hypothetical protein